MGPSFREQNDINWNKTQSILLDAVRRYKKNWARRECVDVRVLSEWYGRISERIVSRNNILRTKKLHIGM